MPQTFGSLAQRIGFVLTRIVVPFWVLMGALFKLYERTPANLPSVILKAAKWREIDLDVLLRSLIGLELLAVGVMLLIPRLARAMAIFMLSSFCLILIAEIYARATSCGCFGSIKIKPWQMLIIDGSLLLGVLVFRPARHARAAGEQRATLLKPALAVVALGALGLGASFGVPQKAATVQPIGALPDKPGQARGDQTRPELVQDDPQTNPQPLPVPNSWYTKPNAQAMVGKSWRDVDLFQMMPRWPRDLDHGKHYVIFYKRDCDHCRDMFYNHLLVPLEAPVATVQIPFSPSELMPPPEDTWDMPPVPCEMLTLPLGCNWIITPPLALIIIDGKITCAAEGEGYEVCLQSQ